MTESGSSEPTIAAQAGGDAPAPPLPTSLVFVDGTHVDHQCESGFGRTDIDYQRFFDKLTAGTTRKKIIYCTAPYLFGDMQKRQQGALNRLRRLQDVKIYEGRHIRREFPCRKCRYVHNDPVEKGTDVAVASHLVQAACMKAADLLILVAGDNDYWPALQIAKEAGANCKFAYFVGVGESDQQVYFQVSKLRQFSRGFIKLDHAFMNDCWYTK